MVNLDGFDLDYLAKGLDKTKLVLVDVQVKGKNGTFTRKQWKKPSDVSSSDTVIKAPDDDNKDKKSAQSSPVTGKQKLVQLLSSGKSRNELMEFAKKNGVSWKENPHEGINWMRASMAIQKHMEGNPQIWENIDQNSQAQKSSVNSQSDSSQKPSKDSNDQKPKAKTADKSQVQELVQKLGSKSEVLDALKQHGISWKEHTHAGINWMRAMQALSKNLAENPGLQKELLDDRDKQQTQKQLADTQKKVEVLQDLVSQIQNPTAQQVSQQSQQASVLKGITTSTMSSYEKKNFGSIIESASPESLRNYRTLGMCAGDKESEKYLADLYNKYASTVILGNNNSSMDADPLKNKLQGVVNKQVVDVVKSSLKNARKRSREFSMQQKILAPWIDPNKPLTDEDHQYIKGSGGNYPGGGLYYPGDRRKERQTEQDSGHEMLHRVLDKFKLSQEYGQLATEYDQLLTEFDKLTHSNETLQNVLNGVGNGSSIDSALGYENLAKTSMQNEIDRCANSLDTVTKYNSHNKSLRGDYLQKLYKKKLQQAKDTMKLIDGKELRRAAEIREQLFSSKFTDLNVNLYHYKMMAAQLSFQYEIKKDFVYDYPILSKDNLDKLDKGDEDSLTNLALYAGMFKPSLTKTGKSAKDVLMDKFSERKAFLDAYGGVTAVQGVSHYAENNEIKCKISKASPQKAKSIIDGIAADWDRQSHGNMKYHIKGVYEVSGLAVEKQFEDIKKKNAQYSGTKVGGKDCGSDMFYHGTGSMATSLILGHSGEFKLVKAKVGRMLGDGIYLADKSSKSAQYIGDAGYSRSGIAGSLMVVEASIGKTLSKRTSNGTGYDSVFAGKQHGLLNSEWCVHDPHAVIPRYLVEMEIL